MTRTENYLTWLLRLKKGLMYIALHLPWASFVPGTANTMSGRLFDWHSQASCDRKRKAQPIVWLGETVYGSSWDVEARGVYAGLLGNKGLTKCVIWSDHALGMSGFHALGMSVFQKRWGQTGDAMKSSHTGVFGNFWNCCIKVVKNPSGVWGCTVDGTLAWSAPSLGFGIQSSTNWVWLYTLSQRSGEQRKNSKVILSYVMSSRLVLATWGSVAQKPRHE